LSAVTIAADQVLNKRKVFVVVKSGSSTFVSFSFRGSPVFLGQLTQNFQNLAVIVKSETEAYLPLIQASAEYLFTQQ
jgi:hypothetical protein